MFPTDCCCAVYVLVGRCARVDGNRCSTLTLEKARAVKEEVAVSLMETVVKDNNNHKADQQRETIVAQQHAKLLCAVRKSSAKKCFASGTIQRTHGSISSQLIGAAAAAVVLSMLDFPTGLT